MNDQIKKPVERQLFSPKPFKSKGKVKVEAQLKEDELVTDTFDLGSHDDFNAICNMVSVLLREYDCAMEVSEPMDFDEDKMARHKPVCYFVMNTDCIKEKNIFFERLDEGMKSQLKPLFIRAKVENTIVNKILVDGGVVVNLLPNFLLRKIGKYDIDLRLHNMVLSNYEGK